MRELQDKLSANPILAVDGKILVDEKPNHVRGMSKDNEKRKAMHFDKKVIEQIKFADEDDDPFSDTDSFHSLGKHLNEGDEEDRN